MIETVRSRMEKIFAYLVQHLESIFVKTSNVVDNLESDSPDLPLSANMGKQLNSDMGGYKIEKKHVDATTDANGFIVDHGSLDYVPIGVKNISHNTQQLSTQTVKFEIFSIIVRHKI